MRPLRKPTEGHDEFCIVTVAMREELMKIRKKVTGRQGQSLPSIGGFDMSVWICMHAVTGGYDG